MVPDGWRVRTIEEIASVASGGTPNRKEPSYWEGDVPWVTTSEIRFNRITSTAQRISRSGLNNSSAKYFPPGTLLMAMYGQGKTRGQVAILEIAATTNQACAAITLNDGYDTEYFFQLLMHQYERIRNISNSGGQDNLSAGLIKGLQVACPPHKEQLRIAAILSAWDRAITITEQLLTNSQQQKKALMQQLLTGRKRLPGFTAAWTEHRLGELFSERNETNRPDLPLLSITSTEGVIARDDVGRKDTSNADKAKYRRIAPGDIGYNTMRMWQGVSGLSTQEGIVSPAYTILTPGTQVLPEFAAHLFKLPQLVHVFMRHSQGLVSDTWNLKYQNFERIRWPFPERAEQEAIAAALNQSDRSIAVTKFSLANLREEKKALMQQLLTGKRRVLR